MELSRRRRTSRGLPPQPAAAAGAYCTGMGGRCRSCAERQGTRSGAGISRAVPEGSGSDASQHTSALHPTIERAHCAGSRLRTIARGIIFSRPCEVDARHCGGEDEYNIMKIWSLVQAPLVAILEAVSDPVGSGIVVMQK